MYQLKPINSTQHGVYFAGVFLREAGDLEREVSIITRANLLLEQQCRAIVGLAHRKATSARALAIAGNLVKSRERLTAKTIRSANRARRRIEV